MCTLSRAPVESFATQMDLPYSVMALNSASITMFKTQLINIPNLSLSLFFCMGDNMKRQEVANVIKRML